MSEQQETTPCNNNNNQTATSEIKNIPIDQFPKYPAFECSSGELLWGHLHTMMMGAKNGEFNLGTDTKNSPNLDTSTGNTTKFKYIVGAEKGKWVVERFLYESGDCAGFVIHHEDYSGMELLERCKIVGISHGQGHTDKNIVYVNRYDWGGHFRGPNVEENLKLINPDFKFKSHATYCFEDTLNCCRLNLVDAAEWNSIQRHFAFGMHPDGSTLCQYFKGNHSIGVHLSLKDTEYELGWMIFSETTDKLVGFVYDPTYSALEGDLEIEK